MRKYLSTKLSNQMQDPLLSQMSITFHFRKHKPEFSQLCTHTFTHTHPSPIMSQNLTQILVKIGNDKFVFLQQNVNLICFCSVY